MFGQLVPCGGGNEIPLRLRRVLIGRALECVVILPFPKVSAKHCLLELRDGVWFVSDLASRNGLAINGIKCRDGQLLPGAVLSIAGYRYRIAYDLESDSHGLKLSRRQAARRELSELPRLGARTDAELESIPQPASSIVHSGLGELVPCGGGPPIPLRKLRLLVGRSPLCDIVIKLPIVSGRHCQLDYQKGFWHVRDLGSRNGIQVDGHSKFESYLKPGAILSIAECRYRIEYSPGTDGLPSDEAVAPVESAAPAFADQSPPTAPPEMRLAEAANEERIT